MKVTGRRIVQRGRDSEPRPDWPVFVGALGVLVLVCLPLFLFPERSEAWIQKVYFSVTHHLGIFYGNAGFIVGG